MYEPSVTHTRVPSAIAWQIQTKSSGEERHKPFPLASVIFIFPSDPRMSPFLQHIYKVLWQDRWWGHRSVGEQFDLSFFYLQHCADLVAYRSCCNAGWAGELVHLLPTSTFTGVQVNHIGCVFNVINHIFCWTKSPVPVLVPKVLEFVKAAVPPAIQC